MQNKILAVAIASTLCSGVAYGSFENVRDGMTPPTLDSVYSPRRPIGVFDFSTETVIRVNDATGTYGTVYASELFGDARTLPSGDTSKGTYAAVVYTIDGKISDDFEMTFTLTNGATFDGEPLLGVDDSGLGSLAGDGTVTASYLATTNNVVMANNATFAANDIFRFSSHATLYKVTAVSNTTDKNYLAFEQVGTGGDSGTTSVGLTQAIDGTSIPVTLHKYAPGANEAVAEGNLAVLNVEGRAGTFIAQTGASANGSANNMANVTVGRDNLIEGAYYHIGTPTTENIYQVTGVPAIANSYGSNVIISPNLHDNFGTTGANAILTRVYKQGDTKIHVGNVAAFITDEIYQIANHTQFYKVTGKDTANSSNVITIQEVDKTTGLAAAIVPLGANDIPVYRVSAFKLSDGGEQWIKDEPLITAATGHTPALPLKAKTGTGSGKSTATFLIPASKKEALNLETGDRLMLLYKLGNTKALASPGQKINMTVALATSLTNIKVNPARELTVASSKPGIKVLDMKPVEGGTIKISVLSDSKELTGDGTPFIGTNEAKIGYINLDNDDSTSQEVKAADGETKFEVGKTGALADKSTLQVTEGQFAASLKSPGSVLVQAGTTNLQADTVTETDATWNLHDTGLQAIEAANQDLTAIHFKVDGSTGINVPENNPHATLTIDFDDTKMTDMTIEADLRKIKKDGTICHIYNVPNATAADALSIRITNDSAVSGKLTIALYNMDGTEAIVAGTELFAGEEIQPDETRRLSAADLETLAGAAWSGRARAVISSTLPKLAILVLLRQNVPGGALVNLSVGATGSSCNN
ncbi:MAG TPA: hypothetical protein EYP59_19800 [Thiotrichaceae bacterium]|nr:hypothetical protein [Thiotrichaceae bacterium]